MATLLKTSRTQVDRLLDPKNDITLGSLQRAAAMVDRPLCRQHPAPPLSTWGGEFSMTTHGDYWVTRDTRY